MPDGERSMKDRKVTWYLSLITAIAVIFSGCTIGEAKPQKENSVIKPAQVETFRGESKSLGNGTAYSWVILDREGNPSSIGINFTESALQGLFEEEITEYTLALPEEVASTAYNHIGIDWNPHGHEPKGIYDKPHLDFHFYMISPEERDKITASGEDCKNVSKKPAPGYIPEGYVFTPGGVPRMGAHWIDPKAPEFNGQPFNETLIYGFYGGKMVFVEPMVTIDLLKTKPEITKELKLPKCYPTTAYYPTNYFIGYNDTSEEYTVALGGLIFR